MAGKAWQHPSTIEGNRIGGGRPTTSHNDAPDAPRRNSTGTHRFLNNYLEELFPPSHEMMKPQGDDVSSLSDHTAGKKGPMPHAAAAPMKQPMPPPRKMPPRRNSAHAVMRAGMSSAAAAGPTNNRAAMQRPPPPRGRPRPFSASLPVNEGSYGHQSKQDNRPKRLVKSMEEDYYEQMRAADVNNSDRSGGSTNPLRNNSSNRTMHRSGSHPHLTDILEGERPNISRPGGISNSDRQSNDNAPLPAAKNRPRRRTRSWDAANHDAFLLDEVLSQTNSDGGVVGDALLENLKNPIDPDANVKALEEINSKPNNKKMEADDAGTHCAVAVPDSDQDEDEQETLKVATTQTGGDGHKRLPSSDKLGRCVAEMSEGLNNPINNNNRQMDERNNTAAPAERNTSSNKPRVSLVNPAISTSALAAERNAVAAANQQPRVSRPIHTNSNGPINVVNHSTTRPTTRQNETFTSNEQNATDRKPRPSINLTEDISERTPPELLYPRTIDRRDHEIDDSDRDYGPKKSSGFHVSRKAMCIICLCNCIFLLLLGGTGVGVYLFFFANKDDDTSDVSYEHDGFNDTGSQRSNGTDDGGMLTKLSEDALDTLLYNVPSVAPSSNFQSLSPTLSVPPSTSLPPQPTRTTESNSISLSIEIDPQSMAPSTMPSLTQFPSDTPSSHPTPVSSTSPSLSIQPSQSPSLLPTVSPTLSIPQCPNQLLKSLSLGDTGLLTLKYEVVLYPPGDMRTNYGGLFCASLEYQGAAGWIGLAFSEATRYPEYGRKEAIIGIPGIKASLAVATTEGGNGGAIISLGQQYVALGASFVNPAKYEIPAGGIGNDGFSGPSLSLLSNIDKQTLMNGTVFTMNSYLRDPSKGNTQMSFAKYLREPNEIEINPYEEILMYYAVAPLDDDDGYDGNPDWKFTYLKLLDDDDGSSSLAVSKSGVERKRNRQHTNS